jgi:hypothetical protein
VEVAGQDEPAVQSHPDEPAGEPEAGPGPEADPGPVSYVVASPADCGKQAEAHNFYEPGYRATLEAMASHVIAVEGPIVADVLVARIARAHGFQRAGERIRSCVLSSVLSDFVLIAGLGNWRRLTP